MMKLSDVCKTIGGYWYYDEEAVARLQHILIFVEAGYERKQIKEIINMRKPEILDEYDKAIKRLHEKQEKIDGMIITFEVLRTAVSTPANGVTFNIENEISASVHELSFMAKLRHLMKQMNIFKGLGAPWTAPELTDNRKKRPPVVEQMRFLVQHIGDLSNPMDRAYLALHPLRLEEVLGLKGSDIDKTEKLLHIERAVTHPSRNLPLVKEPKTQASKRSLDLVEQLIPYLPDTPDDEFVLGGKEPLSYTQVRRMCERIRKEIEFDEPISPIRFRTTVLTDLYDTTKDIKQAQAAAGHTTAAMTLKHYVKGRYQKHNTASPIADVYGLAN